MCPRPFLAILILVFAGALPAQDAPLRRLVATHLGTADGLPQGLVSQIIQDPKGYLWMGTKDGLARYDGYTFATFRHDEADSTSIIGNHITALLQDRAGRIWVGTQDRGICRYDPATGRYQRAVRADGGPPVQGVHAIRQDRQGNLWVQSDTLWVIPAAGATGFPKIIQPSALVPNIRPLRGDYVLGMSRGTDLWISTADSVQVIRLDGDRVAQERKWPSPAAYAPGATYRNEALAQADSLRGEVLIWAFGSVVRMDAERLVPLDTVPVQLPPLTPTPLLGRNGIHWARAGASQLFTVDPMTGRSEVVSLVRPDGSPLAALGMLTPDLEDRDGNIWLITDAEGVYRVDPRSGLFHVFRPPGYSDPTATDLRGERLFLNSQLQLLDQEGRTVPLPMIDVPQTGPVCESVFNNCVVDPEGRLLMGRYQRTTAHTAVAWRDVDRPWRTTTELVLGSVPCEVFPGEGYDAWVAGSSADRVHIRALVRLDMRTGEALRRYDLPIPARTDAYVGIAQLLPAGQGRIWLATTTGLMCLDTATGSWETWAHRVGDAASLPADMVFSLCKDPEEPDEVLWVGTEGSGLARFDRRTGLFRTYTTEHGLPNNVIYGILADDEGHLWLSTNQGLCHFDPRSGVLRNYDRSDGLPDNEFNRYGFARMRNGTLWFGGMGGTVSFHPAHFHRDAPASATRITGLRLLNRLVQPKDSPALLPAPIDHLKELVLPHNIPMITFDLACMDMTRPDRNTFRYRLVGLDTTWVDAGTNHQATFTSLDPGDYRLEVLGRNSAGVWDMEGASLALIITPPWWGTWWFRVLLVLAAAAVLYALYRYRLAQQLRLAHLRDRIARDLHDEIGSTLSSVALFSEVAKRRSAASEGGRNAMLDRISDSTSRMVESMNDIVWAVNSGNDELLLVVQRMQEFAGRVAEAGGFELDLSFEGIDEAQELDMVQRKNLYLIFKEAVNNAAKYSGCRNLIVRVAQVGRDVVLRVADDGRGWDQASGSVGSAGGGGNGIRNMHARAREMGGELVVRSAPGQGTTVELRFRS